MLVCDNHIHSYRSFDAQNSVEEICKAAIEKGMYSVTITDHCEADGIKDGENCEYGSFAERIPASLRDTKACAEKYKDKLKVFTGVEIGQAIYAPDDIPKAVCLENVDFVLGSIHNLERERDFYYLKYTEENIYEYLKKYFETVLRLAEWNGFDSLAHLTYPLRYICEQTDYVFDPKPFQKTLDAIFTVLVKNERALEINTSGLRMPLSQTMPELREVYRFRQLGGQYITFGSDAHNTADLGAGIITAAEIAYECGFGQYYIYERRTPAAIEIRL